MAGPKADIEQMRADERAIIAEEGQTPKFASEKPVRDPNDIRKGHKLPEGFVNPPCGTTGHRCLGFDGRYDPDGFVQLKIESFRDDQVNPQPFNCADRHFEVPLGKWVDAPIEILNALESAIEVVYEQAPIEDSILRGTAPTIKTNERRRFMWYSLESA